jgi:hypothetical protein
MGVCRRREARARRFGGSFPTSDREAEAEA